VTRRHALLTALLGAVALTLTIMIVARLSANGGTRNSILASSPAPPPSPAPTSPTSPASPAETCTVGGAVSTGPSHVVLDGACRGALEAAFGCISAVDDLYLTGRRQLDPTHILYLTLNVESYRQRPGNYAGAQAVLQLTGPTSVARWSDYAVGVHVNTDGSVLVPSSDLVADPGTGSAGTVTVSGLIGCGVA
jgi:hypothetical protein